MNPDAAKSLVIITGVTMASITLLKSSQGIVHAGSKGQTPGSAAKQVASSSENAFKGLWAIGLSMIVLSFLADQIPEVVGPFALLILVFYVYNNESVLIDWGKK